MSTLLFLGNLNWMEILIILFVGLLIFGNKLPEVGRSLGRGLMEFKKGIKGLQDQVHEIDRETDRAVDAEERKQRALAITKSEPGRLEAPVGTPAEVVATTADHSEASEVRLEGRPPSSP